MARHGVIAALTAVIAVGGLALGGCTTEDDSSPSAPTEDTRVEERQQTDDATERQQEKRTEAEGDERDDLVSFKIDDRSQAGFEDIWVTWTIKNQSSEKSDYTWEWEAVGADGTRLYNSTELATNVQPGQIATGESPTTLKTADVKINITDFERTKAW
ncbi:MULTISPECIES: hypothetical protein [Streptomyces]|uniref:Lipoprotein n=2 Tax=Streptomyces TaxID=1883 RepID=A0AA40SH96_9ACTN|nr:MULTISPECIES: hypothetical protein [Streptomyces]MBA8946497.1 hypothetical protein [Streptomyces calvus]MBA8974244.1 hypothetical protein [Streptomyces calvus]MYS29030.1 hypothetical protein [Streptomyces sp. SID7804]GGP66413.1 hypothetical protein GCM10010247_44230 [Streptomyces calvus]